MSLTFGFYDSYQGDRVYDAEQFSSFLDGIIYDGVYNAIGNKFYVAASSGMKITVDSGRAWFDHTWTLNTTKYTLTISAADTVYDRIDAVVLEVNKTDRKNYLKIVKGTPAASPVRPTLTKTTVKIQHALAYVRVTKGATEIKQSNITYVVDTSETPLVTALALSGIPSGGTIGQVLAKKSSESGAVDWYDPDKLPFDKWYLATGVTENDVLGAYKFINRTSESAALACVNEKTNYSLVKSSTTLVSYNPSTGFTIQPYGNLHNSSIWSNGPLSVIIKFSNAASGKPILLSEINNNRVLYARTPYTTESYLYQNSNTLGFNYEFTAKKRMSSTVNETEGIVGCAFTESGGTLFNNGSTVAVTALSNQSSPAPPAQTGRLIGMRPESSTVAWSSAEKWTWNSFTVQYAIFYSKTLTLDQYKEIRNQIISDAG